MLGGRTRVASSSSIAVVHIGLQPDTCVVRGGVVVGGAHSANQIAHINCGGCGVTLMYAYGAQSVKCAMCNVVTQVQHALAGGGHQPPPAPQRTQTVVVENPPSLDENGKQVTNVVVGIISKE